jgi:hypothetical protein
MSEWPQSQLDMLSMPPMLVSANFVATHPAYNKLAQEKSEEGVDLA